MGKHKDKSKKHKRDKKHKHRMRDSSSSSEEWVEKGNFSSSDEDKSSGGKSDKKQIDSSDTHTSDINKSENREDWMSLPDSFLTESNIDRRKNRENNKRLEKQRAQYNPREHVRELNPYWKDGGDGLPKFKKPTDDGDYKYKRINQPTTSSNWRKKESECSVKPQESTTEESSEILSDKELNILASKLVKAEIMGNTKLVKELKEKLDNARKQRESAPSKQMEGIILTQTDSKGYTRPLKRYSGGETSTSSKKKKVETHQSGQRMRYFPDDDKHSLQQMFENEKYNTAEEQDKEFMKLAGRVRKNDDADEIFADNIRTKESDDKIDSKNRNKAISQHQKIVQNMDNCRLCLQSENMLKHLMITLGETVFLSLPSHEPLTEGHCLISPIRHVSSSTHLDENEWSEIMDFRKSLTKMFLSNNEDVIFFETARNFHNYPHMSIECIPLDKEEGDMAPIYFKKAIDECEAEWAQNKKLVSLKGKDVRKAIPKGLPYFFVSFGMDEGYAHVLEDQKHFPNNFAQEIIGGMLDLHHSKWRKPRQEAFDEQSKRVQEFSKRWSPFDCTKT